MLPSIQILLKDHLEDVKGQQLAHHIMDRWGWDVGEVKATYIYSVDYPLNEKQLRSFGELCLRDVVTDQVLVNKIARPDEYQSWLSVAQLPGVTDDWGISAQTALDDFLGLGLPLETQHIFSQQLFYFKEKIETEKLEQIGKKIAGNPLINHIGFGHIEKGQPIPTYVPKVNIKTDASVKYISLDLPENELVELSKKMVLALNLEEMKAIQQHFITNKKIQKLRKERGLKPQPTQCELEVLGQTWSEHCKHKEFNAIIEYKNNETGEEKTITSLFKTYIKGTTDVVTESLLAKGNDWIIKVFNDNAGVVRINDKWMFVWKVETHNSPSALDPYGGAITGILGNNRDPLATGVGGAKLLFNTNVLCFGPPTYDKPLLTGQLHPKQIMNGVREGIEDGGNKSGIPTVNGSVVFDDRYSGKPLVYCGTGGLMPHSFKGKNSWEKPIDAGDVILMAGGRVGKDGIHGATFSSIEIDEHSPMSAVQIGSPITQKKVYDFMVRACVEGLIKTSTDNGAGGLSSSLGELATISNGAVVQLDKVPLKYAGLKPWEIFVSESQERMSLVCEPDTVKQLMELAEDFEVEVSQIGHFTNNGLLDVRYGDQVVACLDMHFLHEGVPQKRMFAEWTKPNLTAPDFSKIDFPSYNKILLQLLGSLNICSRESIIRQYDHEVKGKTIVKPLMGPDGKGPQDAAVMRIDFNGYEGIAVSNGILPRFGDIDAYDMSAGAFDEAVRSIIAVGGQLPNLKEKDDTFWSVNDNFCVPDSEFHAKNNPDGKQKLAKLVQMCEALYDYATCLDIPLTSGKDSMKNDFKADGQKISVPPTVLYSMTAKIEDIRQTITSNFKATGDLIYQVGETYDELGGSEFLQLFGELGVNVPKVRMAEAKNLYKKMGRISKLGLLESCHDLSDGGLAVAIAECAFGGNLGATVSMDSLPLLDVNALLFAESHSRFVVSIRPENKNTFEQLIGSRATFIGRVSNDDQLTILLDNASVVSLSVSDCLESWSRGLGV